MDRRDTPDAIGTRASGVLNDRPELGRIGMARSSGGGASARFVHRGMEVIAADGTLVGTVEAVEGHLIRLAGDAGTPCHVPFALVDGVDDRRVILSGRGDAAFGIAA